MSFGIGLSAIRSSQLAINTASHNIANASTEGFHRQEAVFQTNQVSTVNGEFGGAGVGVAEIRRFRNLISESALTTATSDLSRVEQSLQIETRIESLAAPGEGSIQDALNGLFDGFTELSANPGEISLRDALVTEATSLAGRLRSTSEQVGEIRTSVSQQIEIEVQSLNLEIEELVSLQNRINANVDGTVSNDLLDQRDQLVNRIAERIDVQRFEFVRGEQGLSLAGNSVSIGTAAFRFEAITDETGNVQLQLENGNRAVSPSGGRIAALIDANNNFLPNYGDAIDEFAGELINQLDQAHAVGIGTDGAFTILQGTRPVSDVDLPLAESGAFPVSEGELVLTVTSPTGERRTSAVSIDPTVDSLRDVAAAISGVDNVQAVVDGNTGTLTVIAVPGFEFDFTGRLESTPDLANFSGTSTPEISGIYTGSTNQQVQVTALGDGVVGRTSGLALQVTDSNGQILREVNVGDGYVAGEPIDIGNGVSIQLGVGEIASGDSFDVVQTANSDTTGILSSIGLNSFFTGTDATNIDVDSRFLESPFAIATSLTGAVSDTQNLESLAGLRESLALDDGRATFSSFLEATNTEIGFRVQSTRSVQVSLSDLRFEIETERDAVSGVDVNEELINLTSHQRSFEAAIQVVRALEAVLDELFQIIR